MSRGVLPTELSYMPSSQDPATHPAHCDIRTRQPNEDDVKRIAVFDEIGEPGGKVPTGQRGLEREGDPPHGQATEACEHLATCRESGGLRMIWSLLGGNHVGVDEFSHAERRKKERRNRALACTVRFCQNHDAGPGLHVAMVCRPAPASSMSQVQYTSQFAVACTFRPIGVSWSLKKMSMLPAAIL